MEGLVIIIIAGRFPGDLLHGIGVSRLKHGASGQAHTAAEHQTPDCTMRMVRDDRSAHADRGKPVTDLRADIELVLLW